MLHNVTTLCNVTRSPPYWDVEHLSVQQVASNWRSNKSDSSFLSHTASQLAEQAVTYFASAVLSATHDCFLLNQEIAPDPILKQHPEVLFDRWHCLPNLNQHNPPG